MSQSDASPTRALDTAIDVLGLGFRALARSLQTGVILLDGSGAAVFANDTASTMLALAPTDDEENRLEQLRQRVPGDLRAPDGEGTHMLDVELGPPASTRRLLLRSIAIEGDACGTLLLVTDHTKASALEASLALASRMRTHGALRSEIHDLKAPLNALSLNVQLLRTSLEEDTLHDQEVRERQLATTDVLQREIARLGRSLDGFLRRSKPGSRSARARRLDARNLVRHVARLVRPVAKASRVRIVTRLPEHPLYVMAESDQLREALLNLVLNALEAQDGGGAIRLVARDGDQGVLIVVEDDGPGIPASLLGKVFEMNFTTKSDGTGIGLTVARSLVEGQGGRLQLESRAGEGTSVTIRLPVSRR